jgi:squalene-associated FAD-dependent desaturase
VVGAGLAGLSAALSCIDAGARVTLLEARPRFGGATWSFERNGLQFDNGQHVYLRCCTAYQRFLERIGTIHDAPVQDRLSIPVFSPRGGAEPVLSWIKRSTLPVPLHLAPSLLSYRHLSVRDRLGLAKALRPLMKLSLEDDSLDEESFASFLKRHGQSDAAIDSLWDLIVLPTLNVHAGEASLLLATKVFQTGLLSEADAADIGWARVPLARLHGDPAVQLIRRSGSEVRSRTKVQRLVLDDAVGSHARGVLADGEEIAADAVICAAPHEQAVEMLPADVIDHQSELHSLGSSPIIDVHLVYDRKVMGHPLAAATGSPVQYVFDRTDASGLETGQCLAVSVSGADEEHGERPEVLIDRYRVAVAELFPRAREAKLIDAVVSREHHATFRARPGTRRLRPGATTRIENLFIAGAWTDTGWPATMEGAVRSGVRAAAQAMRVLGQNRIVPEEVPA